MDVGDDNPNPAPEVAAAPKPHPKALYTRWNAGGGDCFWLAVASLLAEYTGVARGALAAACARVGLCVTALTPHRMRACVYSLFLRPHLETDAIIAQWIEMASDASLRHEVTQAACLAGKAVATLTDEDREHLVYACLDPRRCWGDEAAVLLLERLLGIRCLVLVNGRLQVRRHTGHGPGHKPIVYIVLALSGVHYEAVSWMDAAGREHTAFAEEELPDVLIRLSHRDCRVATEPYISLQHLALRVPLTPERALAERGTTDQSARVAPPPPPAAAAPAADDGAAEPVAVSILAHFDACVARLAAIRADAQRTLRNAPAPAAASSEAADTGGFLCVYGGIVYPPYIGERVCRLQCGFDMTESALDRLDEDCSSTDFSDNDDAEYTRDPAWARAAVRRKPYAVQARGLACPPLW